MTGSRHWPPNRPVSEHGRPPRPRPPTDLEAGDEREEAAAISKPHSLFDMGSFVNLDYSPMEWLKLNGGLRHNYTSDLETPWTRLPMRSDGYSIAGVELDLKARPTREAHVFLNRTYRQGLGDDEVAQSFAPLLMNVGGSYTLRDLVRFSATGHYVGTRTVTLNETEDRAWRCCQTSTFGETSPRCQADPVVRSSTIKLMR